MNFLSKLFFTFAFGLLPSLAFGAAAHVQSISLAGDGSAMTDLSLAFAGNVTDGNMIVVSAGCNQGYCDGDVITDGVNTYTDVNDVSCTNNDRVALARAVNTGTGARTVTVTPSSADFIWIALGEFSGINATPADGTSCGDNVLSTGSIATTAPGLLWAVLATGPSGGITPDASFTEIFNDGSYANNDGSAVYRITTASGSYSSVWTTGSFPVLAVMIALKESIAVKHRVSIQ